MIGQLDRTRFQPWVFYYASGIQLDAVSETLVQVVTELRNRYQFKKLRIVAHSMGGVVTRSFIMKYQNHYPNAYKHIDFVMTINSPMGGMDSAALGVKYSPIVVRSWTDVATGSDFLNELHTWNWPAEIPYYLVFSFVDGKGSDNVVPLKSQLPLKLQQEATRVFGFVDNHVGTLNDPECIALFDRLISDDTR